MRGPPDERGVEARLAFGVVNLDKPAGPSAHQVAAWVRDLAGVERAAHAGTLDPGVTGCLPTLTGDATRVVPALQGSDKEYVALLWLHAAPPGDLADVLAEFEGPLYQRPPRKSAVARELRVRTVHDLTVLERDGRRLLLRVRCESGTYVRKLCHDLGLALGTGAHMSALRRTAADPFDDRDLATLHDLADGLAEYRERGDPSWLDGVLEPAERALVHLPRVTIAPSAAEQVAHGAPVYAPGVIDAAGPDDGALTRDHDGLVACYTPEGAAVCLGRVVGEPEAESGTVVDLERVLVDPPTD